MLPPDREFFRPSGAANVVAWGVVGGGIFDDPESSEHGDGRFREFDSAGERSCCWGEMGEWIGRIAERGEGGYGVAAYDEASAIRTSLVLVDFLYAGLHKACLFCKTRMTKEQGQQRRQQPGGKGN